MADVGIHSATALAGAAGLLEHSAIPDSERLLSEGSVKTTAFRLGTTQPTAVTVLNQLLGPTVTVVSLAACLCAEHVHPSREFCALAVLIFLVSQRILSTPEMGVGADGRPQLRPTLPKLLLEWAATFALLLFLITALHAMRWIGSAAMAIWLFIAPAALIMSNLGAMGLARWCSTRRQRSARYIIIGATEAGLELAKRVQLSRYGGEFLGFFDFRDPERLPPLAPAQWGGACTGVVDFVRRHAIDAIYIALPISTAPRIAELLQQLRDTTASIYLVPANIFAFRLVQPRCIEIHGIPALAVCETPHQGMSGLLKRSTDVALAILALPLAAPLMLIIAAAIKLTSRGTVFFRQRRYGLNGEDIFVYKFRTMSVCEDGPAIRQATRDDQRITSLGRLLRRSSLDELPQILNVLQGRMSFVGPRPHAVAHNELYRKLIGGYMIRHKVRPGITGWAQIHGFRGETNTLEKMRRRVEYDIDYLNSWSLGLDFKILLRTLALLLRDRHAY